MIQLIFSYIMFLDETAMKHCQSHQMGSFTIEQNADNFKDISLLNIFKAGEFLNFQNFSNFG